MEALLIGMGMMFAFWSGSAWSAHLLKRNEKQIEQLKAAVDLLERTVDEFEAQRHRIETAMREVEEHEAENASTQH